MRSTSFTVSQRKMWDVWYLEPTKQSRAEEESTYLKKVQKSASPPHNRVMVVVSLSLHKQASELLKDQR